MVKMRKVTLLKGMKTMMMGMTVSTMVMMMMVKVCIAYILLVKGRSVFSHRNCCCCCCCLCVWHPYFCMYIWSTLSYVLKHVA